MSLMIECPNCGKRPLTEFLYGEIPEVPESMTDADARDIDRAFMLKNVEGVQVEAWFHVGGCRRWVKLFRDTRTDQFVKPPEN